MAALTRNRQLFGCTDLREEFDVIVSDSTLCVVDKDKAASASAADSMMACGCLRRYFLCWQVSATMARGRSRWDLGKCRGDGSRDDVVRFSSRQMPP